MNNIIKTTFVAALATASILSANVAYANWDTSDRNCNVFSDYAGDITDSRDAGIPIRRAASFAIRTNNSMAFDIVLDVYDNSRDKETNKDEVFRKCKAGHY
jgi:hypothetical protein